MDLGSQEPKSGLHVTRRGQRMTPGRVADRCGRSLCDGGSKSRRTAGWRTPGDIVGQAMQIQAWHNALR